MSDREIVEIGPLRGSLRREERDKDEGYLPEAWRERNFEFDTACQSCGVSSVRINPPTNRTWNLFAIKTYRALQVSYCRIRHRGICCAGLGFQIPNRDLKMSGSSSEHPSAIYKSASARESIVQMKSER